MTKLPKIEKCVCGAEAMFAEFVPCVRCSNIQCWMGEYHRTKRKQILAWNAVMKAAKAAKKPRAR